MTIYEVTINIQQDAAPEYEAWLREHIGQMLQLQGFLSATWTTAEEAEGGTVTHCVHYFLRDRDALQHYFLHHAEAMRQEGVRLFGGKFTATRRVLNVKEQW